MLEQSVKFLYMGLSIMLFILGITSFYTQEVNFNDYYSEIGINRQSINWLTDSSAKQEVHSVDFVIQRNAVESLIEVNGEKNLVLSGIILKQTIYGLLLEQDALNQNQYGSNEKTSFDALLDEGMILEVQLTIEWQNIRLNATTMKLFLDQIDEKGLYGLETDVTRNIYKITRIL